MSNLMKAAACQSARNRQVAATEVASPSMRPLELDGTKLLWIFTVCSIGGLVLEIIYHAIAFGGYESRAGLVWGPFSPIYGVGAAMLTVLLNRAGRLHPVAIFVLSAVVGLVVEYFASLLMETVFGAVAWDYSNLWGNIGGRTCLGFGLLWGALGIAWTYLVIPLLAHGLGAINEKSRVAKVISVVFAVFMAVNIVVTVQALDRESERALGVPAVSPMDQFFDQAFPSNWIQHRFHNMSIYGSELQG